ncbi:MAG: ribosome biogenesis GTPase YlqF [Clostridiales bacterium]|uniref:ribosome biogenesis GTPase YlqF n=1 Tax=Aminipila sp. TaxID=2060095 RepID=UPI001D9B1AB0|nr:ribosome biogenesis GTPase YlqF [Aminipila sp.]MBE6033599.1 ribosome biogenesis GTPase YlqF [Clostridiales bacterium]
MIENINWYPGHMKKTRELIQANLKMVDLVIEVIDARIPISSRNPIINDLIGGKQRVIVLNKVDLADNRQNERWTRFFKEEGHFVVPMNCMNGSGVSSLLSLLSKYQDTKNEEWSRKRTLRMMIVGVPNVGKSSLINRLLGKKSAKTGDRPGVTRGKQWLTLSNGMQLLDTPGILWPKFEDPLVGLSLAFCGSIRDETMDLASLALELVGVLQQEYPEELMERYKLIELGEMPLDTMEAIALKRGFILSGKRTDYERTARTLLDEFRAGIIGRITLEHCEE